MGETAPIGLPYDPRTGKPLPPGVKRGEGPLSPEAEWLREHPEYSNLNIQQIRNIMSGRWPQPGTTPGGLRASQVPGGAAGGLPVIQTGLESLRRLHGVIPEATELARGIVSGIEEGYEPPAGTFAELERPAISALGRELRGDVTPRERADVMGDVMSRFRGATGAIAERGARGGAYIPSDFATAAAGAPSAELATGLGQAGVGLERLGAERRARALSTARGYLPEITGPRKAFGSFVGQAGQEIPVLGTGGGITPSITPPGMAGPGRQMSYSPYPAWASSSFQRRFPGGQPYGRTSTGGYMYPGPQYITYGSTMPSAGSGATTGGQRKPSRSTTLGGWGSF